MAISGISAAWRPELAAMLLAAAEAGEIDFTEVLSENLDQAVPADIVALVDRGVTVIPDRVFGA